MPAKTKSRTKKAGKRTAKKTREEQAPASKSVPSAPLEESVIPPAGTSGSEEVVPVSSELPPVIETPPPPNEQKQAQAPVTEPVAPVSSESQPPPPPPVATTEENLEAILDDEADTDAADRKNTVIFITGIVVAAILAIASVVIFVIYANSVSEPKSVGMKEEEVVSSPTPTPSFSRAAISFEVLNASGVSGAAGSAAAKLEEAGYTVLLVGNSKKQDTTEVYVASTVSASDLQEVLADMSTMFSVASSAGDLTGTTASARLILGSK